MVGYAIVETSKRQPAGALYHVCTMAGHDSRSFNPRPLRLAAQKPLGRRSTTIRPSFSLSTFSIHTPHVMLNNADRLITSINQTQ